MPASEDLTTLLADWRGGDDAAFEVVFGRVYGELRRLAGARMRDQAAGHTLSATALVHEAYLKLVDLNRVEWEDRAHFFAVAATAMRHILISHARKRGTAKRGAGRARVSLDRAPTLADGGTRPGELLALDQALDRLERLDARMARTVELRFFGGLTIEETAEALGVAPSTVKLDWRKARAWLYRELSGEGETA